MQDGPEGMDVEFFLKNFGDDPHFSQEPYIYCCRQEPQENDQYYWRCGAAGLQLFPDADRPYLASANSRRGLSGRMTQYIGHIRPNRFVMFAALRIKKQSVALPHQRLGGDPNNPYNIDQGNLSAVRVAEMIYHHHLDSNRYVKRFPNHPESELFHPSRGGVDTLLKQMRKVQGLEMLLFDNDDYRVDEIYEEKGGQAAPTVLTTRDTTARKSADRVSREPRLIVRMSDAGIDELRSGNPNSYKRLLKLMRNAFKVDQADDPSVVIKLKKEAIEELKKDEPDDFKSLVNLIKTIEKLEERQTVFNTKPVSLPPTEIIRLPTAAVDALRGAKGENERKLAIAHLRQIVFNLPIAPLPAIPPPPPPAAATPAAAPPPLPPPRPLSPPVPRVTRLQQRRNQIQTRSRTNQNTT